MILPKTRQLFQANLHAHKLGSFSRWKSFVLPFRSSSVITAKISDIRPKTVRLKFICGEGHSHKGFPNREKQQPKCANCKGPHVGNYKGCPAYKKQVFRQHVVDSQKSYASILKQNLAPTPQPQGDTFTFTADQLVKFVANVAIEIAQPQVCYITAPKDAVDRKSSLCRRVSEADKSQLGISISGNKLFNAIGSICAPVLPASKILVVRLKPFRFSVSNTKPPTILY